MSRAFWLTTAIAGIVVVSTYTFFVEAFPAMLVWNALGVGIIGTIDILRKEGGPPTPKI